MTPEELVVASGLYGSEDTPTPISGGLGVPEQANTAPSFSGGLDLGVNPARKRRSPLQNTLLMAADLFNISASMPNALGQSALAPGSAYLGQSMERANAIQKAIADEDPEGRQIDLNRAKVLSQKAYQEADPVKKAMYGREIKKLLPEETQGLDDLTAADMFTSNEKIELERLKQTGRIQLQQLKNSGNLDVATLKSSSAEEINRAKLDTQWDIAQLNNEYKKAIADGNNERAITVAQMITDRQTDLADLNNAAKLKQVEMQQEGANYRTGLQQEGANYRTEYAQNAAFDRTKYAQDSAMERVRAQQEGAMARVNAQQAGALERANIAADARIKAAELKNNTAAAQDLIEQRTSPEMIEKMKSLNDKAGRWYSDYTYDVSSIKATDAAKSYQEFEGLAKQIVQDQLRKIYGAQFTEKEGERFFKSMGLNPKMEPNVRWALFMNAINDLRLKSGKGRVGENSPSEMKVGETTQVGGYKVTRRN